MHCSALPRIWCPACLFLAALTNPTRAEVVLQLMGGPQFAVEQAFPHSPTEVHPIEGESLIVWGLLTNNGPGVFEATGPGGTELSSSGTTTLWQETPYYLWDPLADPDDPFIVTSLGYPGVTLDQGESLALAVSEVWGLSASPLGPAPVGSLTTFSDVTLSFWDGLDRDPNDPSDLPDVFVSLDSAFTVTVVPEPATLLLVAVGSFVLRRHLP